MSGHLGRRHASWQSCNRGLLSITVAVLCALVIAGGCRSDEPSPKGAGAVSDLGSPPTAQALDELFIAVDATRAEPSGRYRSDSEKRSTNGAYDSGRLSVRPDGGPEVLVAGTQVCLQSSWFPQAPARTPWLSVPLSNLAPLENRSPGLADEVAALAGAAPPGIGPALAAMRTATEATSRKDDTLWARLDLSNMDKVNPRDQGAVVAWAGLWARKGGERQIVVKTSLTDGGLIDQVVFDPKGTTPAGPYTLTLTELGAPVPVTTPPSTDTTPLK